MERQLILVVLVNHDVLCAYPIGPEDAKKIGEIRQKVQERVRAEVYAPRGELPSVRCQITEVDMPTCSPDGFIASLVNDILDKVSS